MNKKMNDYIKREDAKNMMRKFRGYYDEDAIAKFEIALGAGYIPPNEDVVEVVRCKDCKHNYMKSWNQGKRDNPICHFTDFRRSNEFYCGFGERAEG